MSNKREEKKRKNSNILSLAIAEHDPLYGCWINQEWKSAGYAYILIARKRKTGLIAFAAFWIDLVKGILDNCAIEWNCTEDFFQKNVLKKNPDISFFNAEISVAREIIENTEYKMQNNGKSFPEQYSVCKKILGAEEKNPVEKKQPENVSTMKNLEFFYEVLDHESAEADLRQIEVLEESEESQPGHRCFDWKEEKKRGLFSKSKEKSLLAKVILEDNKLLLEILDEKKSEYLQDSLLQYLGTTISAKSD